MKSTSDEKVQSPSFREFAKGMQRALARHAVPDPPQHFKRLSRPAEKAAIRLWPVAYRHASDHMQVMIGVRKALKEAHRAAERAGGLEG